MRDGKLRFGKLKKYLPNITKRMLTLQLRKMEQNKLVKRTVYAQVPPKVEYELTEIGMEISPILSMLEEWGEKNLYLPSDLGYVYSQADTMQKREFVNLVFEQNLYYKEGIFRTPTMLQIFTHKVLEMKEKGYFIYKKKRRILTIPL
ncbi:MAG: winged helix-turn-helix transcriptional regulator [Proteiniphilum sp.]|nr:winged helix-turn-helix transcriptional regulator [Proteiniphilum sp.]MEA5128680.1 winged helix-turn-helix transcriptional regulator [Proteiniphilum sp.]